jgi:hypothetical protein
MEESCNTKVKWIIECVGKDTNSALMAAIKLDANRELHVVNHKDNYKLNMDSFHEGDCVVFHGSILGARTIRNALNFCYPVAWFNEEHYKCSWYYPSMGELLFNKDYLEINFLGLINDKWDIYRKYGKEAKIFVRPNDGDKMFTGQLVDLEEFNNFTSLHNHSGLYSGSMLIVSTPKEINGEWRFIVTIPEQGMPNIVAASTYMYQGMRTIIPSAPTGANALCRKVLEIGRHPAPVYCIDVCEDKEGKFHLLEINSFSASGLYDCNKYAIVRDVSKAALEDHKNYYPNKPNNLEATRKLDIV